MTWYQPLKSEFAFQLWRSLSQSDDDKSAFLDDSHTMGLGLVYEDYHNRNRARESYNSITREMGSDMKGELVIKLSHERF